MTKTARRINSILLAFVLLIATTFVMAMFSTPLRTSSAADTFIPTDIAGFSGGQFGTSSTTYPASPDGFTGAKMDGSDVGAIFAAGIVDLDRAALNTAINADSDSLWLKGNSYTFAGGQTLPQTPFGYPQPGDTSPAHDNTKSLMINSPKDDTFYAFKSNTLTLEPSKYYEFRVSVMTGNFTRSGAYIKLVGASAADKINLSFGPIDTSSVLSNYGWVEYSFYVKSSSFASANVNLSLQIGDYVNTTDIHGEPVKFAEKARGVAFFDNVQARIITRDMFEKMSDTDFVKTHTPSDSVDTTNSAEGVALGYYDAFANHDFEGEFDTSRAINSLSYSLVKPINVTNYESIQTENALQQQDNPLSPFGSTNVLMLRNINSTFSGYKTSDFTVEMHRFYRLSVWYKAGNTTSGATARLVHEYDPVFNNITGKTDYTEKTYEFSCTSTGDTYYNGWSEAVFYINGSVVGNKNLRLELLLGTSTSPTTGVVFFDDISLEYLLPSEFAANSANGTLVSFDEVDFKSGNNPSIANGNFFLADTYTKFEYPLKPASFSSAFAGDSMLSRAGSVKRNDENIISGIIPVNDDIFQAHKHTLGSGVFNPYLNSYLDRNILYVYSPQPTAYGYLSPEVSLSASAYLRIEVEMLTNILSGTGANLVLRTGDTIIAEITNIDNMSMTKYNFYVEAGKAAQNLSVEIWLGQSDGKNNDTKLSSGYLYIDHVLSFEATQDEYNNALSNSNNARFSFKGMGFDAYSNEIVYPERPFLLTPYTWQVRTDSKNNTNAHMVSGGIVNGRTLDPNSELYTTLGFTHESNANPYVLMLSSNADTASYLKSVFSWNLDTTVAYYRITVSIKTVGIPTDGDLGARIKLVGTNSGVFSGINTEKDLVGDDKNEYKDYYFYVHATTSLDVGFEIWLGDDTKTSLHTFGNVFVRSIAIDEITESLFSESTAAYDEEADLDDEEKTIFNIIKINTSDDNVPEEETTDEGSNYEFPWWGIPTILIVLALLTAVFGVLIKKHGYKLTNWVSKLRKKQLSYDRNKAAETIHAKNVERIRREKLEELTGESEEDAEAEEVSEFDEDVESENEDENEVDEPTNAEKETVEETKSDEDENEDINKFDE